LNLYRREARIAKQIEDSGCRANNGNYELKTLTDPLTYGEQNYYTFNNR